MGELKVAVLNGTLFIEAESLNDYFEMRKKMKDMPPMLAEFVDIMRREIQGITSQIRVADASIQMVKKDVNKKYDA